MPRTAATTSVLARNVRCLGERDADLAARLASAAPAPDVTFTPTPQGVPAVEAAGVALCSRHRPLDEARRLADPVDLEEHAVVVVLGFGAGYHVQRLAERLRQAGLIIVFEPDVGLLRAVLERIDHSAWLRAAPVLFVTDPSDRGALAGKLEGAEALVAQGVAILEHPPSRRRLGEESGRFARTFGDYVTATKTTFLSTLMRAVDTVRNLLLNLDHYAAGHGVAELRGAAAGRPAVVVSAGPSLDRNGHLLADPEVRRRCVIVTAQTTLRPLLAAGIRPHFVTALDFHEISRRFYEGLGGGNLDDVTLVADPKAHPVILDAFPGPVRCCGNEFLDRVLGPRARPMGDLPAGATVAHLAVYLARYLGCNPIVLAGQDLAFSDGLYYASGTAIDEVWAPELNPFNTIEMMQWQRIVRHRQHLSTLEDVHGRPVLTDAQMLAYLQQFERDFARYRDEGVQVIDATEGGLPKQHAQAMELAEALERHAGEPLPELPRADRRLDPRRLSAARDRVRAIERDMESLRATSRRTEALVRRMLDDQGDARKMNAHFAKMERYRASVEERLDALRILNQLNQLGVFRRFKADRRLHLQPDLDPVARQRAQLERDLDNVAWTREAAGEILDHLRQAEALLAGGRAEASRPAARLLGEGEAPRAAAAHRIAALVPIDPQRNGLGVRRSLEAPFGDRTVLAATLERLGRTAGIESIILIAPDGFDAARLLDPDRIGVPVIVERCDGSPFGPEREAIAAARRWSGTCWRGGIAGMSIYDEVVCPRVMSRVMAERGLTAALVAGPDWPFIDASVDDGCGAIVARHLEQPDRHKLVFTQAPPGLGACLVSASLMLELAQRNRLSTIGALLVYQPHVPQHDPIARSANVQIDYRARRSRVRATLDSPRRRDLARLAAKAGASAADVVAAIEALPDEPLPRHVVLELCTRRASTGLLGGPRRQGTMPVATAQRLFEQLGPAGDVVVTLGGDGDPLLHDELDAIVRSARDAGILGVHVRTELAAGEGAIDSLLACEPDVVSVDLHADSPQTYRATMGADRYGEIVGAIERLVTGRRRLTDHPANAALAVPWVVPRMMRCAETLAEIDSFFDRWTAFLGAAVIDPGPPGDGLLCPAIPAAAAEDESRHTMAVGCDGTVVVGGAAAGNVADAPVAQLWRRRHGTAAP